MILLAVLATESVPINARIAPPIIINTQDTVDMSVPMEPTPTLQLGSAWPVMLHAATALEELTAAALHALPIFIYTISLA